MWEQIEANKRTSQFLIVGMCLFLLLVGSFAGVILLDNSFEAGLVGAILGFTVWLILFLIAQIGGESILLGVSGAHEIKKEDHPQLYNIVEEMKIASGLEHMPRVYIIEDPSPNAFATGLKQEKAAVAVTTGLLERLNRSELQGVIAHEISHVINRDTYLMLIAGTMVGSVALISEMVFRGSLYGGSRRSSSRNSEGGSGGTALALIGLIFLILAPLAARVIYFAISRKREYLADASAVQFTRHPEGLAQALIKISEVSEPPSQMTPITAPMYIHNPGEELFATHPPIQKRVQVLMELAGMKDDQPSYENYARAFAKFEPRSEKLWDRTPPVPLGLAPKVNQLQTIHLAEENPLETKIQRKRSTKATLQKIHDFIQIECDCETTLKIPPAYHGETILCPYCGKHHQT
ncbi:MAG: M48 family metallopeptidase [Candidatus Caenarcaniphilales bacterium]|nr:M48 family metallopeptidase [Candidatus Caenarcaniphilales bacterium]